MPKRVKRFLLTVYPKTNVSQSARRGASTPIIGDDVSVGDRLPAVDFQNAFQRSEHMSFDRIMSTPLLLVPD